MVPIDDARLYYATYGDPNNEPIVLVHGRLGNADEFVHQIFTHGSSLRPTLARTTIRPLA